MPIKGETPGVRSEISGLHRHTVIRGYWDVPPLTPGEEPLHLEEGLPDFPPNQDYRRIQKEIVRSPHRAELVKRYGDFDMKPLKDAILARFGDQGLTDEFEVFLNGGGSYRSLQLAVHFLPFPPAKSRTYIVEPSFPAVENYILHIRNGALESPMKISPVIGEPNSRYDDDLDGLIALGKDRKSERATLVFLAQPRAGKGDQASRSKIDELLQTFNRPNDVVLISETAADFLSEDASAIPLLSKYNNLVIAKGLGKIHGDPQDRIGLLLMSKQVARHWEGIRKIVDVYSPSVDQYLMAIALLDPKIIRRRLDGSKGIKSHIKLVKRPLIEALIEGGFTVLPSDDNDTVPFMVVKVGRRIGLEKLTLSAAPGIGFGLEPGVDSRYFRITVPSNLDKIPDIVRRLQKAGNAEPPVVENWGEVPYELTDEERKKLIG